MNHTYRGDIEKACIGRSIRTQAKPRSTCYATTNQSRGAYELGDDNARIKAQRILIYASMEAVRGWIEYSDAARKAWPHQPTEEEIEACLDDLLRRKRKYSKAQPKTRTEEDDTDED